MPEEEIHLWYIDLDQSAAHEAWLASSLGRAERVAADQFFFTLDRRRFVTRRGVLRLILSEYLEIGPADLSFRVNANGKPELTGSDIRFSVSHSAGLAAYALSWRCELGVDIERLRPLPDALQIAAAFFSSSERSSLEALPAADQLTAFFRCWTRKEAFVKALGEGLSYPLDQFEVFASPGEPAGVSWTGSAADWSIVDLTLASGWVGALVMSDPKRRLVSRRWLLE